MKILIHGDMTTDEPIELFLSTKSEKIFSYNVHIAHFLYVPSSLQLLVKD